MTVISRFAIVVAIVLAAAACIAARVLLFTNGTLYGEDRQRYANIVLAGVLVGLGLLAARVFKHPQPIKGPAAEFALREAQNTSGIVGVATVAGLVAATLGLVQLTVPATPINAAAGACEGARVYGAPFYAQTQAGGVNARSGPGVSYEQVNRYGGDCTLGFEGYCIGQAVTEDASQSFDTRWLIVFGTDILVSAAKVKDQTGRGGLGESPDPRCDALGGEPQPNGPKFRPTLIGEDELALTARSEGAALMGYSVRVVDAIDGFEFSAVGQIKSDPPRFEGTWIPSTAANSLKRRTGVVQLAAVTCLGADVPSGDADVFVVEFDRGQLVSLKPASQVSSEDAKLLRASGCASSS